MNLLEQESELSGSVYLCLNNVCIKLTQSTAGKVLASYNYVQVLTSTK